MSETYEVKIIIFAKQFPAVSWVNCLKFRYISILKYKCVYLPVSVHIYIHKVCKFI